METGETVVIRYEFSGVEEDAILVTGKLKNGTVEITNTYLGKEAVEKYTKLNKGE